MAIKPYTGTSHALMGNSKPHWLKIFTAAARLVACVATKLRVAI